MPLLWNTRIQKTITSHRIDWIVGFICYQPDGLEQRSTSVQWNGGNWQLQCCLHGPYDWNHIHLVPDVSRFFTEPSSETDHFALIVFALIGTMVMVTFANMIMLFLGIEILSIALYILAGSHKTKLSSNEAALKYFLMGSFIQGFLLFGIALIYGATGSFNLAAISSMISEHHETKFSHDCRRNINDDDCSCIQGVCCALPFWAPDVYQGCTNSDLTFMSTVVKTAAFAAFYRTFLFTHSAQAPQSGRANADDHFGLTILVGNITAVYQTNFKRMLAYSSISHAGYMVLAILAMNQSASSSLMFYATAYSISSITAFAILLLVSHQTGNDEIRSFNGLAKQNPFLSAVTWSQCFLSQAFLQQQDFC